MQIYSRYKLPVVPGLKCEEHSLTEQVYKDQCDLNFLIKKYGLDDDPFALTMYIDPTTRKMQFVDTTLVPDLYAALSAQRHLRQMFDELDYSQKKKFNFSVEAFQDFCMTASEDEIKKLGLKNLVFKDMPAASDAASDVASDAASDVASDALSTGDKSEVKA